MRAWSRRIVPVQHRYKDVWEESCPPSTGHLPLRECVLSLLSLANIRTWFIHPSHVDCSPGMPQAFSTSLSDGAASVPVGQPSPYYISQRNQSPFAIYIILQVCSSRKSNMYTVWSDPVTYLLAKCLPCVFFLNSIDVLAPEGGCMAATPWNWMPTHF